MSRYNFALTNYECVLYMESTPEEDKLDELGDCLLVQFTGNGYLHFWTRCQKAIMNSGLFGTATITDTWDDSEKVWHIEPKNNQYAIKYTANDIRDLLGKGVDASMANDIAIYANQRFHECLPDWVAEKYANLTSVERN